MTDSRSLRMVRERLIDALSAHVPTVWPGDESDYTPEETREAAERAAGAALAALGLDDLDASKLERGDVLFAFCAECGGMIREGDLLHIHNCVTRAVVDWFAFNRTARTVRPITPPPAREGTDYARAHALVERKETNG